MAINLCKCNNCETVLIDENPQVNAKEHVLDGSEMNMVQIPDENGYHFWACPNCNTDEYLTDL